MKFTTEDETKEEIVRLYLTRNSSDGKVNLMGKENNGTTKYILTFCNGRFTRETSANLNGMETDERGRIKEEDGDC